MDKLIIGQEAPYFQAKAHTEETFSLKSLKGKRFVLYFYPKDNTPGCTTESCAFRDSFSEFQKKETLILGVSKDTIESHKKFAEKYQLPFPLLSDHDLTVCKAYGVWKEKKMMGKTYMGIIRSTFLIDQNGILTHAWNQVKPNQQHINDVLQTIQ